MDNIAMVSIIMPVYNSEDFIEASIMSVENQTYQHIELICINDKTPDDSFEICKKMSEKYANIKLIENDKNMGQAFSRNRGIEAATGKYILFLDSDDILVPETIEQLVAVAEKNPCDMVLFSYTRITDEKSENVVCENIAEGLYQIESFAKYALKEYNISDISNIGTKLYRTDFLKSNDITFKVHYRFGEDAGFMLEALLNAKSVYYLNKHYYKYYIRSFGSTMSSYRPKMFISMTAAREIAKSFLIKNNAWYDKETQAVYYSDMLGLMLNSLINEVKFGDKQSFREACEIIRNYKDFDEMCEILYKTGRLSKIRKLILPLIKKRRWGLVHFFVKLQQIKK